AAAGQPAVNSAYYDGARLIQISQGSSTAAFTCDPAGRRSTLTLPNGITTSYSYDNASQLTGLSYQLGATELGDLVYEFDLAGRRWSTSGGFPSLTPSAPLPSTPTIRSRRAAVLPCPQPC